MAGYCPRYLWRKCCNTEFVAQDRCDRGGCLRRPRTCGRLDPVILPTVFYRHCSVQEKLVQFLDKFTAPGKLMPALGEDQIPVSRFRIAGLFRQMLEFGGSILAMLNAEAWTLRHRSPIPRATCITPSCLIESQQPHSKEQQTTGMAKASLLWFYDPLLTPPD